MIGRSHSAGGPDRFQGEVAARRRWMRRVAAGAAFALTASVVGGSVPAGADPVFGVAMVADIAPGITAGQPDVLTNVNGTLFFRANDGTNGVELWRSDGTSAGTAMVADINSGSANSSPSNLVNVAGTLYFTATTATSGSELWKSDGTPGGTVQVAEINPGTANAAPGNLTVFGGALYFTANNGTNGIELWSSDGTSGGTAIVADITVGSGNSSPGNLRALGSTLFFTANNATPGFVTGAELWKTDGTGGGTVLVKDINPGTTGSSPGNLTVLGSSLYFSANNGAAVNGAELWTSDGTTLGTAMVKDIRSGTTGSSPANFVVSNGTLFFTATDAATGTEPFKSDGTEAGTVLLKDVNPTTAGSFPGGFTDVNGTLVFFASDGTNGLEPWKSDGTTAGTVMLKDIAPGANAGSLPQNFVNVNGTLFFQANEPVNGVELWKSDLTAAGTALVSDICPGAAPTGCSSVPAALANVNGTLFFRANNNVSGNELWKTTLTNSPVAAADAYSTNEDTTLTVAAPGVLANDTDADSDPLTAVLVAGPSNGGLTLNADGSFSYLPGPDFAGADSFTYRANDGALDSNVVAVAITVTAVNDAPVAADDAASTTADTPVTVNAPGVLSNDTDADGNALTAGSASTPANGAVVLNADGSYTYTPDAGFDGTDSFTYVASDGQGGTDTATVSITVTAVNEAPTAVDDSYTTAEDIPLTEAAPGVLGNDTDPDANSLTAGSASTPANGAVVLNADGSFTYTPNANFNGSDSFTYVADDGQGGTDTATVAITVSSVNDAPVAVDDSATTTEDTPVTVAAPGVLGNDTDVEANSLTAGSASTPANGAVVLNADGSYTYTPNANFNGTDTFTYVASDGLGATDTATVTITLSAVNDAPVAANDAASTTAGTPVTVSAPGVLTNDTDADGDTLTAGSATDPAGGSVVLNADGSYTYTPDTGFTGVDSFTYKASDGTLDSNAATVSITVTAVNIAPVAVDDAYNTTGTTPLVVAAPGLLGNDTDADGGTLSAGSASDPAGGSVTLNPDGSFTYTADSLFAGDDTFTYVVSDGQGGSDTGLVTITVAPDVAYRLKNINPGTASSSPTQFTQVGSTVFFRASNGTTGGANGPELWKSDGTGGNAELVKDIRPGTTGSNAGNFISLGGKLLFTANDGTNGTELWTSDGTAAGTVVLKDIFPGTGSSAANLLRLIGNTVYFQANDGTNGSELWKTDGTTGGTVLVKNINPGSANSAPGQFLALGSRVLFNANDGTNGNELWITDGTAAGTVLVKDINPGSAASTPFAVRTLGNKAFVSAGTAAEGRELWMTDGTGAGTVLVKDVRPGPDSSEPDIFSAFGDIVLFAARGPDDTGREMWKTDGTDAGTVLLKDISPPGIFGDSNPSDVTPLGNTVLFAAGDFFDVDGRELWKTDGTEAGTVMVKDIDPSGSSFPSSFAVLGGVAYFTASDGTNGGELWKTDGTEAGTVMVKDIIPGATGGSPSGLTPALGTLFFTANDGTSGSEPWRLAATAAPLQAPVAVDDAYTVVVETPRTVAAPGVLANDTDAESNPLTAGPASDPANGSVTLNANGSFTYTPDAGFTGTDTFTYVVSDNQSGSDTGLVTITVTPPPGPTTLSVGDVRVAEGDSGATAASFTITRSGDVAGSSSVKYKTTGGTATAGTDYSGPVPLTAVSFGPDETTKTVTVDVTGDTVPEKDETFNLVLSAPVAAVIADTTATATIVNDDGAAYLSVSSVTVSEGNSGTVPAAFVITRSGNTTAASTVTYRTNGGTALADTDYTALPPTTVTFGPDETTKAVNVDVTGDLTAENNETFNLVLSVPSVGTVLADASGLGTIVDDEGPITAGPATFLAVDNLSVNEGSPGTTAATFTITRSGNTTGPSTVKYKTSGGTATAGTDYTGQATLATLSFAAGQSSQSVTVNVTGDTLPEKDETFNLVLSASTGATIADASGTATIVNDDGAAYLSVGNISLTEGNAGTTAATFTITRTGNTDGASTVKYKTTDGTAKTAGGDYTAVALTTVTFAPGQTTQTVTVDITGDSAMENNETFNLVLSAPVGATISDAAGTATITNDD